jgi:hypothetical protein
MGLKVDTIQNPSSATVNLTLDTSGNVAVGNNMTVAGTSTFTGSLGNITAGTVTASTGVLYPIVNGTAQASTSGTSIDFTSIPSWVKRITVMFSGVSTNGTSNYIVQLGDSGGIETTGYLGSAGLIQNAGSSATASYTTGFGVFTTPSAASVLHGALVVSLMGSNLWVASGAFGASNAAVPAFGGGSKTLSDTLTQVRITTVNGTDTFDAGSINIQYE